MMVPRSQVWLLPCKVLCLTLFHITDAIASVAYTTFFFLAIYTVLAVSDVLRTDLLLLILYVQRLATWCVLCLRLLVLILEASVFLSDESFTSKTSTTVLQLAYAPSMHRSPVSSTTTPTSAPSSTLPSAPTSNPPSSLPSPQSAQSPPPPPSTGKTEPPAAELPPIHGSPTASITDHGEQDVESAGNLLNDILAPLEVDQKYIPGPRNGSDHGRAEGVLSHDTILMQPIEEAAPPPDPSIIASDLLQDPFQTLTILKLSDSRASLEAEAVSCGAADAKTACFSVGGDIFSRQFDCIIRPDINNNTRASEVLRPWMEQCHQGRSLCLMLDGASGTGKSWAFCEGPDSMLESGVRSFFNAGIAEVSFMAVEIYLNTPKDLLIGKGSATPCYGVFPASEKYTAWILRARDLVSFEAVVRKTLDKNRIKSSTENNINSSRGHTICVLRNAHSKGSPAFVLCDFAGAENLEDIKSHGSDGKVRSRALVDAQRQESQQINTDRTALETWTLLASENKICPGDTRVSL